MYPLNIKVELISNLWTLPWFSSQSSSTSDVHVCCSTTQPAQVCFHNYNILVLS